ETLDAERRSRPEQAGNDGGAHREPHAVLERVHEQVVAERRVVPAGRQAGDRERQPRRRVEREADDQNQRQEQKDQHRADEGAGSDLPEAAAQAGTDGRAHRAANLSKTPTSQYTTSASASVVN